MVWAADQKGLLSDEQFSVGRILIEAATCLKDFQPKEEPRPPADDDPGNPSVDFRGERWSNEIHTSTANPKACLLRKGRGQEVWLAFLGYVLMQNCHRLLMDFTVSPATGTASRSAVPEFLNMVRKRGYRPRTLGADRDYDTQAWVRDMRVRRVTPHVAQKQHSAIDGRTTQHAGYAVSLCFCKRVEQIFGWMKTVNGFRRARYRGVACTDLAGYLVATAYT